MPNRGANKGKIPMSIKNKKVGEAPLCFKCGGHGHYVVVCPKQRFMLLC